MASEGKRLDEPRASPARRLIKRGIVSLATLLVLSFAVLAASPRLIGERWIYRPFLERLAAGEFQLDIEGMTLRWFAPVELRGVVIAQQGHPDLVRIAHVRADRGLFGYALGGRDFGRLTVEDLEIDAQFFEDGNNVSHFVRAIDGTYLREAKKKGPPRDSRVAIEVRSLRGTIRREGVAEPLVVVPPLDLDLVFHVENGASTLHAEPARLLDHVSLTPELMRFGLEFIVPLLARGTVTQGEVSLTTGAIDLDLKQLVQSKGTAVLTLHEVKSEPTGAVMRGIIERFAKSRGKEPIYEFVLADDATVDVKMADTCIHHSGLRLGLPRIEPDLQVESSGMVGIATRELDLRIAVPIPVAAVKGPNGTGEPLMITVPVIGTLDEPRVDWGGIRDDSNRVFATLQQALETDAPNAAKVLGLLEQLTDRAPAGEGPRSREGERSGEGDRALEAEGDPTQVPVKTPVRDLLKRLRGKKD